MHRQREAVRQKQLFLDQLTGALTADYRSRGGWIYCGRGCSTCCSLVVNCTCSEALLLAETLNEPLLLAVDHFVTQLKGLIEGVSELKEYLRRQRDGSGGCPLLGPDGACRAYERRPFSCRALLSTKESRWCGTDFTRLTSDEQSSFMASLDPSVTAFPLHYLASSQDAGRELERQSLLAMAGAHGFSLYGNMPVLIHLASRHGLETAIAGGAAAVKALLVRTGLDNPLLLQLEEL